MAFGSRRGRLSAAEKIARLRLIRTETVGPTTFCALIAHLGTAEEALQAIPELAKPGGRQRHLKIPAKAEAEHELAGIETIGAQVLFLDDADYPPLLAAIEDAPPVLIANGAMHLMKRPTLAILGARNASSIGRKQTERLARDIAEAGTVVIFGLARGIDTAAHRGALAGGTIAVVAGGLDVTYPGENAEDVCNLLFGPRPPMEEPPMGDYAISAMNSAPEVPESLRRGIYELLSASPITIDDLARDCDAPVSAVLTVLLEMELAGTVERHPGGRVSLGDAAS